MNLFGSDERKEHVESNLDSVEEEQSVLVGDELEVDKVNNRPDLPRSLASRKEIVFDLASNSSEGVTVDESKVGEENRHENWAPKDLVNENLFGDRSSILSGDLVIKKVVEVVTGRSVVEKTECGKSDESLHVESTSRNENLCQQISKCPSNKGSACLGSQWTVIQCLIVAGPSRDGTSTNEGRIAEERALVGRLAEGRLDDIVRNPRHALGDGRVWGHTERTCGGGSDEKETKKLHDDKV